MNIFFDFIERQLREAERRKRLQVARFKIEEAKLQDWTELKLIKLELTCEDLRELLPDIKEIAHLDTLNLNHNKLTTLPEELLELTNLEVLRLKSNQLTRLPERIGNLIHLNILDLCRNRLETLPDTIANLNELVILNAEHNQLETLTSGIGGLSSLQELDLGCNKLAGIPKEIGNLHQLEYAVFSTNALTSFPEELRDLERLQVLSLDDNQLTTLPARIGDLNSLRVLDLTRNRLTYLPRTFQNLNRELVLAFRVNPLPNTVVEQLAQRFSSRRRTTIIRPRERMTNARDKALRKIYGIEAEEMFRKMEALDLEFCPVEGEPAKTSKEILKEFLEKIPIKEASAATVFNPAARFLLGIILDANLEKEQRQEALQKIAISLGNCATPVKNFLTQTYVGMHLEQGGDLPEYVHDTLVKIAVEEAIIKELKGKLGVEAIEKVQALLNSLFLKDSEKIEDNKVKIKGQRNRLPSGSVNTSFGFLQITNSVATAFAKMCCKTNVRGGLQKEDGQYLLDPKKITAITEPYFANLGLISQRERLVQRYKERLEQVLVEHDLTSLYEEKQVLEFLDTRGQQAKCRAALLAVPDHEIESTYHRFVAQNEVKISRLAEVYTGKAKPKLPAMTTVSEIPRFASTTGLSATTDHSEPSKITVKPSRQGSA